MSSHYFRVSKIKMKSVEVIAQDLYNLVQAAVLFD